MPNDPIISISSVLSNTAFEAALRLLLKNLRKGEPPKILYLVCGVYSYSAAMDVTKFFAQNPTSNMALVLRIADYLDGYNWFLTDGSHGIYSDVE